MRLPEDRIKQGILHPEREVRDVAVRYFSECFSPDPSVVPLVIQAVGRYGWREAVSSYVLRDGLAQTDETLSWIVGELSRDGDLEDEDWPEYYGLLVDLLAGADAHLLSRHESEIMNAEGIEPGVREAIAERIRLLSADPDACWAELGEWCQRERHKQYASDVNFDEPCRLVEAIARHGEPYAARVLSILQEKVEDFRGRPMGWMEPAVVRLAGEMRLESAIPILVEKLHEEGDVLLEECERALARIGTNTVVERLCRDFSEGDWSYRLRAAAVLERIRSDLVVTKCAELLETEEDPDIRVWLGHAVLHQLSYDGVEPVRRLILRGPLDPEMRALQGKFLAACTLMEVDLPEMEQWRRDVERAAEERRNYFSERFGDFADELDEYGDENFEGYDEENLRVDGAEPLSPPARRKVGRNDPCPCGSGKKFKKCCLRKEKSDLLFE